jgi:hypothetical protein
MRLLTVALGLAVISPMCAWAQSAALGLASTAPPTLSDQALSDAAFVSPAPLPQTDPSIRARSDLSAAAFGEVFATPAFLGESLGGQPQPVSARVAAAGEGLIAWRSSEVSRAAGGGAVDSVRLSIVGVSRTPFSGPNVVYDPNAVDVTFTRGWPSAVLLRAGDLGMSVSPHAGFGMDSMGGNRAEAGAMVRFSSAQTAINDKLSAMGVKNGATYGDRGRWYLFAAVQGQSVGLNMLPGGGGLHQAGWSTDASSAMVGDGQIGVGWRKGGMEASVGYVHRDIKLQNAPLGASDSFQDSVAAFSLTFHPGW